MKNFAKPALRRFCIGLLALAGSLASAMANEPSPELKAVIAAADKEGALKLTWAPNVLGGARGAQAIVQGMNKHFGSNVKVNYAPGADLITLGFQTGVAAKAGRPAASDVLIGVINSMSPLHKDKLLQTVAWQQVLPGRITGRETEAGGGVVRLASLPYGIAYNTRLHPNPPKTMAGFLAPQFKGKIASTPYAAGIDNLPGVWGKEKALDFVKNLSGQLGGLMRCSEMNRIASGEFEALVLDCGPLDALLMKEKGLPVDEFIPHDFVNVSYFYGAVPVNAESPNAAKLFIAYLMTEEGQKLQWDLWRLDFHQYADSQIAKRLQQAVQAGGKPTEITLQWIADNPVVDATRPDILKLLRTTK